MSAHDGLPRTKFGDVEFPGEVTDLQGEFRHHIHEYPHTPGGAPEKLGRKLYKVTITAQFHNTFPLYPGLYPDGMNTLRGYYELGSTLTLTHPTAGQFPAFITNWRQKKLAKVRSGEVVDIDFIEDQAAKLFSTIVTTGGVNSIQPTADQLATDLANATASLQLTKSDQSLFDALQASVNGIVVLQDTANLYGNLFSSRLAQMVNLCSQIDGLTSMQDARAWPVIDTLRSLQALGINVQNDQFSQQAKLAYYTVPFTQSAVQLAITLYGDASKQSDLLSLNQIDDPMNIRAGTVIRYYPTPAQQAAA